jgi:hypothetical protein
MADLQPVDGAPGLSTAAVVVTEEMVTVAARAGDLERLRELGRQGMRVETVVALITATFKGHLDVMRCLV